MCDREWYRYGAREAAWCRSLFVFIQSEFQHWQSSNIGYCKQRKCDVVDFKWLHSWFAFVPVWIEMYCIRIVWTRRGSTAASLYSVIISWRILSHGSREVNRDIILATRYFFCQTNQKYQLDWESAQFHNAPGMHFLSLNTHLREWILFAECPISLCSTFKWPNIFPH